MPGERKQDDTYNLRKLLEELELYLVANMRRNLKRHEREEEKEGFRWEMWQEAKLRNIQKYRKENKDIVNEYNPKIEKLIREALENEFERAGSSMSKVIAKVKRGTHFPKSSAGKGLDKPARKEADFFGVNKKKIEALQEEAVKNKEPEQAPEEETVNSPENQRSDKPEKEREEPEKSEGELPEPDDKPFRPEGKEKELHGKDNQKKLDDMTKQVVNDLNKAQRAVWRRVDDIYRQTIYRAEMHMATGVKTLDQAIDMATKEFLEKGIDCIEYKNGRRVNIASYAEMCLRTASQRATLLAEGKKRDEWGIHTVVVSAHANTCPLCALWQGKVLIDDVFSHGAQEEAEKLGYPLLSTAMKAGLLHPNCRHTISTFFPGVSTLPEVPDTEKALETYRAEQEQRALERKIKKWKRIAEGSCDGKNIEYANENVGRYQREILEHLDKHPEFRRDYSREKTRELTNTKSTSSNYGYENFDKKHLVKDKSELLPSLEKASIPDSKIAGYALNKEHPIGKNKALAFEKYLGYNIDNKEVLLKEVRAGLRKYKAAERAETKYGKPYEVSMIINGANGRFAKVKTGWIIDQGTDCPRLTTMYVDE